MAANKNEITSVTPVIPMKSQISKLASVAPCARSPGYTRAAAGEATKRFTQSISRFPK